MGSRSTDEEKQSEWSEKSDCSLKVTFYSNYNHIFGLSRRTHITTNVVMSPEMIIKSAIEFFSCWKCDHVQILLRNIVINIIMPLLLHTSKLWMRKRSFTGVNNYFLPDRSIWSVQSTANTCKFSNSSINTICTAKLQLILRRHLVVCLFNGMTLG